MGYVRVISTLSRKWRRQREGLSVNDSLEHDNPVIFYDAAVAGGTSWVAVFGAIGLCCSLFLASRCSYARKVVRRKKEERWLQERHRLIGEKEDPYSKRRLFVTIGMGMLFLLIVGISFRPWRDVQHHFRSAILNMRTTTSMFENSSFAVNGSYNHINHVLGIINRHNRTQENRNLTIINETLTQALANSRKSGQSSAYLAYRIDDVLNTADSYQRTYGVKVAFTYTALVCGTTVVYLLSLVPSRICACVYKAIVPAKVVAVTVVWVVAGVVFLLGLLTSDFCWDPNRNVLKLLKSDPSHSTAYKTVAYFTNCSRSENLTLTDGIPFLLNQTKSAVNQSLHCLRGTDHNGWHTEFEEAMNNLSLSYVNVTQALNLTDGFQRSWTPFVDEFCVKFFSVGISPLFALTAVMAVLMVLTLCFGRTFCTRHPGQTMHDFPLYEDVFEMNDYGPLLDTSRPKSKEHMNCAPVY